MFEYPWLWIGFFVLLVGGGAVYWYISTQSKGTSSALPYTATPLLTEAERKFFAVLEQAVPQGCYVLSQVRLASLVTVRPKTAEFWKHFAKIGMKCVDFVVVKRETMAPILVVELDDKSHDKADRRERDVFVNEVLGSVGMPIVHWPALSSYDVRELSGVIQKKIKA